MTVALASCAPQQTPSGTVSRAPDGELGRIHAAVERALDAEPPRGYAAIPPGVRLLAVARDGDAVVIDLSRELLSQGSGRVMEDALHQILTAASSTTLTDPAREARFRILIDGQPLEQTLAQAR